MQTLTFTYTKADGSVSERTLIAMVTPSDKYAGIDVSMMEPQDAAQFAKFAQELHDEYVKRLYQLQVQFDLKHNYRQFLAKNVTQLTEI